MKKDELRNIEDILVRRDGMSQDEANKLVADARERVWNGEDPEYILYDEFRLEPDYILQLIM
mgnify:CR=1 FL=1|jgi:hypothetical protein